MKKIILASLMVAFTIILIACGGSDDLIGTWEREHDFGITTIVFNDDNTGTWNLNEGTPDRFEWSTSGNMLTKEFVDYNEIEEVEYEIDGNQLTLIEHGNEFIYIRVE